MSNLTFDYINLWKQYRQVSLLPIVLITVGVLKVGVEFGLGFWLWMFECERKRREVKP